MNIKWVTKKVSFGFDYENGYCGKWELFSISYNFLKAREEKDKDYIMNVFLSGIKDHLYFNDVQKAKEKAQEIINDWIEELNK